MIQCANYHVGSFILFSITMRLVSFKTKKSWPPYNDTFWTKSKHWAKVGKPGNKILGLPERWGCDASARHDIAKGK
jgi:hypothetical protein